MKIMRYPILLALVAVTGIAGAQAAMAADLARPSSAPPVYKAPPPPAFSWTGFYIGGNLGGAWDQGSVTDTLTGLNFSNGSNNGTFIGGGQVGANYQIGNLVLGVEGDFDWLANNSNSTSGIVVPGPGAGNTFTATANDQWITTITGRLGWAWDRVLVYGKGGGAWVGNNGFTVTDVTTGTSLTGTNSNTTVGWTAGGGVEWAFAYNWTVRAEYDYIGVSNRSFTVPATSPLLAGDVFTINRNIQMVTVGVNYLFGGPAIPGY